MGKLMVAEGHRAPSAICTVLSCSAPELLSRGCWRGQRARNPLRSYLHSCPVDHADPQMYRLASGTGGRIRGMISQLFAPTCQK
jgi:hypothetical protein